MKFDIDIQTLFIIIFSALIFAYLLYFLINSIKAKSKTEYLLEENRVRMEEMRRYFEDMVYEKVDRLTKDRYRWEDINHLVLDSARADRNWVGNKKSDFVHSLGVNPSEVPIIPNTAFILTPFHSRFDRSFEIIVNACRSVGLSAFRGDEEHINASILPYVINKIISSSIIIANIDGRNPNVFYELGIAHALNKDVIIVSSSLKDVPFDLQSQKIVLWKTEGDLISGLSNAMARIYIQREKI